jgi:hypothetical protein
MRRDRARVVPLIVVLSAVALPIALVLLTRSELGAAYSHSDGERVYFSGDATESDARTLAAELAEAGYFDGKGQRDVLMRRGTEGLIISFMVQGPLTESSQITYRVLGRSLAKTFGDDLKVRLVDEQLTELQEVDLTPPPEPPPDPAPETPAG